MVFCFAYKANMAYYYFVLLPKFICPFLFFLSGNAVDCCPLGSVAAAWRIFIFFKEYAFPKN